MNKTSTYERIILLGFGGFAGTTMRYGVQHFFNKYFNDPFSIGYFHCKHYAVLCNWSFIWHSFKIFLAHSGMEIIKKLITGTSNKAPPNGKTITNKKIDA